MRKNENFFLSHATSLQVIICRNRNGKRVESFGFLKRWKQITIMLEAEKYILRCVRDKGNFEFTPQDVRYCNLSFLYKKRSGIRSKFHIVKNGETSI